MESAESAHFSSVSGDSASYQSSAWAEGTNWSTYIDAVADADATLAEDMADIHTAVLASVNASVETLGASWVSAESTAATDSADAVKTFTTNSTAAHTAFEQEAKLDILNLTTGHNTERADFLNALGTQAAAAESDSADALTAYNLVLSTVQGALTTSVANDTHTPATALAAAGRTFAVASAGSQQIFRESSALAVKARDQTMAGVDKTQADAEALAATDFADAIWSAWEAEWVGALGDGVTLVKALAAEAQTFSDALALAAHTKAVALGSARGEVIAGYAVAQNLAEAGQYGAVADRLTAWKGQIAAAGYPLLADHRYLEFYPVHAVALASLEPTWWESLIPIYGTAYSAANNFSKGNIWAGVIDIALGLPIYGVTKGAVRGLGLLATRAGVKVSGSARAMLTVRGAVKASARNRGFALSVFAKKGNIRLVHMSENAQEIISSGQLGLPSNIYAGPASNASFEGWQLTFRTGLSPRGNYGAVFIPRAGEVAFKKVTPIGPMTAWQRVTGQQYAARGILDLKTGAFTRTGVNWNQVGMYVQDAIVSGAIVGGVIYIW